MVYSFFEWDYINNEGVCHMSRNHYLALLDVCIKYSSYFSLRFFCSSSAVLKALDNWIVSDTSVFPETSKNTVYYRMNQETKDILAKYMQNVLCFSDLEDSFSPEDFSCYRSDGTLFLKTITHKGMCHLYPQANEDIVCLLGFGCWYAFDENGYLTMPAKLINIKLPNDCCLLTDPFYLKLLELKKSPHLHLHELTPKGIETWISNYWPTELGEKVRFPSSISILPKWYTAFRLYVLSQCDALTSDSLSDALEQCGFVGLDGYNMYFSMLNTFVNNQKLNEHMLPNRQ